MVVKCPNCNHYISDKASICPKCGITLSANGTPANNYANGADHYPDSPNISTPKVEVFPELAQYLRQHLIMHKETPDTSVCTSIEINNADWELNVYLKGKCFWYDNQEIRLGGEDSGLCLVLCFPNLKYEGYVEDNKIENDRIERLRNLNVFSLFIPHKSYDDGDCYREYAIDLGNDVERASQIISEVLQKVYLIPLSEELKIDTWRSKNEEQDFEKGLKEELKYNLKLQETNPDICVSTDLFMLEEDGSYDSICIMNGLVWRDGTSSPELSAVNRKRLCVYISFSNYSDVNSFKDYNDKINDHLAKFTELEEYSLFTTHQTVYTDNQGYSRCDREYVMDLGCDLESAARLVTDLVFKVKGFCSGLGALSMFTNVGNDNMDNARNEWLIAHGFAQVENNEEWYNNKWGIASAAGLLIFFLLKSCM